jgi:cardiolipin synthase
MQFTAALRLAGLLLLLSTTAACSSLPNVRDQIVWPGDRPPTIVATERTLNPAESHEIVARLASQVGPTDVLKKHLAREELVTGNPLVAGNRVTLLADGPSAYAAMMKAIQAARDHINLETYIFEDDEVGQRFADLLIKKAAQGVQVNLLYDAIGAIDTSPEFFERLRRRGILTLEFNPVTTFDLRRLNQRNHRKILVVDGLVAFIGGVNISRVYSKSPFGKSGGRDRGRHNNWRDSHIQIECPSVADFQRFFMDDWIQGNGVALPPVKYFPDTKERGKGAHPRHQQHSSQPFLCSL